MGEMSTRDKILGAALTLFSERGYDATSIDQIAESIGIKGPSLYRYFKGKEDILNSVLENGKQYHELHFEGNIKGDVIPKTYEEFKNNTLKHLIFTIEDPIIIKYRKFFMMEQYRNEYIASLATRNFLTDVGKVYITIFERMMEDGLIKGDDPEALALEFISPITLLIQLCDRQPDKKAEAIDVIERHIDHFCKTYGAL